MDAVLSKLPSGKNENVLVGFDKADDAGVYRLSDHLAVVETVDFFTPIVDDPYTFGQIAAANSLSDVYAMGGKPVAALSVVAYPGNGDLEVLERILRGGFDKMAEAECAVIGGHSIDDQEIKFGYSVTGTISPQRILTNAAAQPGDELVLTKRLGTGVITTALKHDAADEASLTAAVESMRQLNRITCETMLGFRVHSVTDITGFGLLGHAREMAQGSGVGLELDHSCLEFLPGALEASRAGHHAGGLKKNREFISCAVEFRAELEPAVEALLYDPQTSGGLLISVDAADAAPLVSKLREAGVVANTIGRVLAEPKPPIVVV